MATDTRNLKFRIAPEQHEALKQKALAANVSASEFLRRIIAIACDEPDPLRKGKYRPRKT